MALHDQQSQLEKNVTKLHQDEAPDYDAGNAEFCRTCRRALGKTGLVNRGGVETHEKIILEKISGFEHLAYVASAHHERVDGKGYPNGQRHLNWA